MYRWVFVLLVATPLTFGDGRRGPAATAAGQDGADHSVVNPGTANGTSPSAATTPAATPRRIAADHLPNAVQVHPRVISGGQPDGEAGFQELQRLGVRTVISVDGARPDTAAAKRYGLRYVHLPHGYDGIPEHRVQELAKAVRDLEGAIYIHCHHGKHRSPAAASVACVASGLLPPSAAVSVLDLAGTSPSYRGLYQSAAEAKPLGSAALDALQVTLRESIEVPPMAEAMVALERTHDRLLQIAAAGWQTPEDHPDLDPAHQALLLREHFAELLRSEDVLRQPAAFRERLRDSQQAAGQLEDALRQREDAAAAEPAAASLQRSADRVTANCKACHQQFRDIPLTEKP